MRNTGFILHLVILLTCLIAAPASAGARPTPANLFTFEPSVCPFEVPFVTFLTPEFLGFECGYVTVPERHADPDGPTLRLPVALRRARGAARRPDPLFLAQGGPGGDAFGPFSLTMPNSILAQERDIVIFNQRGALHAEPELTCPELQAALPKLLPLPVEEANQLSQAAYADCYERLRAAGINLSAYNSLENAADVEAIRQALGYDEFNFYGVSYGTLLGLHLMRTHPEHLRSVILDAVVPPQLNFLALSPQNTDRIFTLLLDACRNNTDCQAAYPNLETRFFALVDRLNEQPIFVPLTDPDTGQTVEARLDGDSLLDIFFQVFYLPQSFAIFPKIVADLETGDDSFIQDIAALIIFDRSISYGMYFSVICAEDADFDPARIPLDGIRPQIADRAAEDLQESIINICQFWQVDLLPSSIDEPVRSDIPTLLLSGRFDPVTPPANADAAAEFLPNSFHYVYPLGSHGALIADPCVARVVQDFLDDPFAPPGAACLDQVEPDGFVPPDALRVELISHINQLDPWAIAETITAGLFLLGVLSAFLVWPLVFVVRLLSHRKTPTTSPRLRWSSRGVMLLFGLLAILFVTGLNFFLFQSLGREPFLLLSVVSASAAPVFVIPFLLVVLALLSLILMFLLWLKRAGSLWGRLYYTFLTVCTAGYVAMLAATGMMNVLV